MLVTSIGEELKAKWLNGIKQVVRYASGRFLAAEINYVVNEKKVLDAKNYIETL